MKKIIAIATILAAVGASYAQDEVYSVNIVGFSKVGLPAGGNAAMVACNFEAGGTNTLTAIFGDDQLTQDNNYNNCDKVAVFDPTTQTYQQWAQWTDGVFYKANDLVEWNSGIAGDPEIPLGSGVWLKTPAGASPRDIVMSGDVVSDGAITNQLVSGLQIVSFPYSSDIAMQDTSFFDDGAAADNNYNNCDKISIWEGDSFQQYAVWTDGVWYKANDLAQWNEGVAATNNIQVGQAFFYKAQSGFLWSETNRYASAFE